MQDPGNTDPNSCGGLAYLPLVAISPHVTRPLLAVVNVLEGVVACGDPLWVVNLKERWEQERTAGIITFHVQSKTNS